MDEIINSIALKIGLDNKWVWFAFGALVMLLLKSLRFQSAHDSNLRSKSAGTFSKTSITAQRMSANSNPNTQITFKTRGEQTDLPADVVEELRGLFAAGNKIQAIKLIREKTGLGLAEAKGVAESLEQTLALL